MADTVFWPTHVHKPLKQIEDKVCLSLHSRSGPTREDKSCFKRTRWEESEWQLCQSWKIQTTKLKWDPLRSHSAEKTQRCPLILKSFKVKLQLALYEQSWEQWKPSNFLLLLLFSKRVFYKPPEFQRGTREEIQEEEREAVDQWMSDHQPIVRLKLYCKSDSYTTFGKET